MSHRDRQALGCRKAWRSNGGKPNYFGNLRSTSTHCDLTNGHDTASKQSNRTSRDNMELQIRVRRWAAKPSAQLARSLVDPLIWCFYNARFAQICVRRRPDGEPPETRPGHVCLPASQPNCGPRSDRKSRSVDRG